MIPAAGYAVRLQPLRCSKEVLPIAGKPVMDHLAERLRRGGCSEIRVVTRPEKPDVIDNGRRLRATVIEGHPDSLAESLCIGMDGLDDRDVVLFGFPDSIWQPLDGFSTVLQLLRRRWDIALGLFQSSGVERPDAILRGEGERVVDIHVGADAPPPNLMWGCAAARRESLRGLEGYTDPGRYFASRARAGAVGGVVLSDEYLDMGTKGGLRQALARQGAQPADPA